MPFGFGSRRQEEKPHNNRLGTILAAFFAVATIFILAPLALVLLVVFALTGERRRIRLSRWAAATGVASVLAAAAAGFSTPQLVSWLQAGPALTLGRTLSADSGIGFLANIAWLREHITTTTLVAHHAVTSIPIALAVMTVWWWYRSYALRLRGENEGEQYSDRRPVGWVDRIRIDRNTQALKTGEWARKNNAVAVGIGTYGHVASVELGDLKKAMLIVGTSQSGKTRQANSIAAQEVVKLGGGNIVIDWKDDDNLAAAKADLAHRMGVPFLHFKMVSRTGGGYKPPHPYAPDWPAHYDPLQRGNGASKAAMLLNSVPRDGDAAVYLRTANEIVKLAFDIASLTGLDRRTDEHGHPISGLRLLTQMLDREFLVATANSLTVEHVLRANPFLTQRAAEDRVANIQSRINTFNTDLQDSRSTLSAAIGDVRSTVASYVNDAAAGPFLTPGTRPALRIDLVRAILRNEIVVFSLPAQEYPEMASMIGTMVLLDLQNAVATLRTKYPRMAELAAEAGEAPGDGGLLWNPVVLQIEEVSAVRSTAAAEAMLGLFNKSADVGIRPILSTQSLADIEAVDGTGVWLRQLLAQLDHLMTLQLSEAHDAETVARFSGVVQKKIATEQKDIDNNRTGLFQGAGAAGSIIARTEDRTRIGEGEALQLGRVGRDQPGEMLWISKVPDLQAVHTTLPEGPNNWAEVLDLVPVHERPHRWDAFADPEYCAAAVEDRDAVFGDLAEDLRSDRLVHEVVVGDAQRDAVDITGTTTVGQTALLGDVDPADFQPSSVLDDDDAEGDVFSTDPLPTIGEGPDNSEFDFDEPAPNDPPASTNAQASPAARPVADFEDDDEDDIF